VNFVDSRDVIGDEGTEISLTEGEEVVGVDMVVSLG